MKKKLLCISTLVYSLSAFGNFPSFTSPFLRESNTQFLFGAATAAPQCEAGLTNHQWYRWINECCKSCDVKNHKVSAEETCVLQKTYKKYVKKAYKIGLKALRFSVEWSEIKPTKDGEFNEKVLDYYEDMCKECEKYGITPFITLYHYSEPLWFWDIGSFEKAENTKYFVEFCIKVFERLNKYKPMWLTFNTPSGIMGKRYLKGARPTRIGETPKYKKGSDCIKARDFMLAGTVLKNVLNAHVEVYLTLKALPGGAESRIGFLKNIQQHDPYNAWNPVDIIGANAANYMADDSIIRFLRTGHFSWSWKDSIAFLYTLGTTSIETYNPSAPTSFDFIGLNYYTRDFIKGTRPVQKDTDIKCHSQDKIIYPEGIYRALMTLQNDLIIPVEQGTDRHIPIYITENGIATQKGCESKHRKLFFEGYLNAIERAMKEGVDVRGYINWALMDNWSWGTYKRQYGLFKTDRNTQKIVLKTDEGTQYFVDVIKHNAQ